MLSMYSCFILMTLAEVLAHSFRADIDHDVFDDIAFPLRTPPTEYSWSPQIYPVVAATCARRKGAGATARQSLALITIVEW